MARVGTAVIACIGSLLLVATASGCGENACQKLSDKVCECESSEREQQSCKQWVDDRARSRTPTAEQEARCDVLYDGCTCQKLANGEWSACGLSRE